MRSPDSPTYEALFEANLSALAVHSLVRDPEGRPVDYRFDAVNPAFEALFGVTRGQVVGRTAREAFPGREDFGLDRFVPVVETGVPVSFEHPDHRSGRRLLVHAFRHQTGGFTTSVLDLTDRSQAERQYKSFFDIPSAVKLVIDPEDGRILEVNPKAAQFYGWSREELLRMKVFDLNPLPVAELGRLMKLVSAGRLDRIEVQHRLKTGELRSVEVFSGIGEWSGRPALFSIIRDVTEARTIQQQLLQGERLRAVGELSASLAHEFGNLLGVLFAQVQLMELELPDGPLRNKTVRRVHDLVGRAHGLIESIKSFSRAGNLERNPVRLMTLLDQLLDLEAPLSRAQGVRVDLVPWVDDRVEVNVPLLQQVLLNLFRNALHALRGREDGRIALTGGRQTGGVWIEFSDNGPGLTAEAEARLFLPFFTTKKDGPEPGTGLGLSFSRMVLRRQGGDLLYIGGPGARFRIELPD